MIKRVNLLLPSKKNPRNSEGSMVDLGNRKLLFAYTLFTGGANDQAASYIAGRYSIDAGESWLNKNVVLIENEGKVNTMSVSLLRLMNGEIIIGYLVREDYYESTYYIRKSLDNGVTWSKRVSVTGKSRKNLMFVVNNDRMVQLKNGRVIIPAAFYEKNEKNDFSPVKTCVFYSDDDGLSWERSKTVLVSPDPVNDCDGLQEPGVVELKTGKLLMWMRSSLGSQLFSYSSDKGITWTAPIPSVIISPLSPMSLKRIPATNDLLAIYNDSSPRYAYVRHDPGNNPSDIGERTPLIAAISKDEGKTWGNHTVLEDDPQGRFCYTSILFIYRKVILSYTAEKQLSETSSGWGNMRVTLFDYRYLYA